MRSWEFGNPMFVAMRHEEASCHGCKFKDEVFGKEICNNPKRIRVDLRRCKLYTTGDKNGK